LSHKGKITPLGGVQQFKSVRSRPRSTGEGGEGVLYDRS